MIHLSIVDLDERFRNLSQEPIIANDVDMQTADGKLRINNLLITKYEGDALQVLDSCQCGCLQGGDKVGLVCGACRTICVSNVERELESAVWMRVPEGVEAFLNPGVFSILRDALKEPHFDVLMWLLDPYYSSNHTRIPPKVKAIEDAGIERGINSFYHNFDKIMEICWDNNGRRQTREIRDYMDFVDMYRDRLFCHYIPMPSKLCFVVEQNDTGTYADRTMSLAIDAMLMVANVDQSIRYLPTKRRESRVAKALAELSLFHITFYRTQLSKKEGLLRKHVYGGRIHFSARAVITSISENHNYDEIHIPWSLALELLKVHITNKLLHGSNNRRRMTPVEIDRLLIDHATKYSPLLDSIFKELIAESFTGRGIPMIIQRNPTLELASAQLVYVTVVKDDPNINTISMSVLILKGPNADFDGDELNLMLILSRDMYQRLKVMAPHCSVRDTNQPRAVSKNLSMPGAAVATINRWIMEGRF